MEHKNSRQQGMTLIEMMIALSIIVILAMIFLAALLGQMGRARDADRKSDLEKIKIAFEDYYNDNNCYPPATILDSCNSSDMEPYLDKVPCDPVSMDPYLYLPNDDNQCAGYRLFARLNDVNDPKIQALGCGGADECGVAPGFNYGISSGMPLNDNIGTVDDGSGGSGAPSNFQGPWACSPDGACNHYGSIPNAFNSGCPFSFSETNCQNRCGNANFICDS